MVNSPSELAEKLLGGDYAAIAMPSGEAAVSIAVLLGLLAADFVVTRRPHEVTMAEAVGWSGVLPAPSGAVRILAVGSLQ